MSAGFTPGPWVIESKDGREDARGYWIGVRSDYVAMVCRQNDEAAELPNAHLIAAAPALYEALEGLIGFAENAEVKMLVGDEGCLWPVEFARAALKQARGEA